LIRLDGLARSPLEMVPYKTFIVYLGKLAREH